MHEFQDFLNLGKFSFHSLLVGSTIYNQYLRGGFHGGIRRGADYTDDWHHRGQSLRHRCGYGSRRRRGNNSRHHPNRDWQRRGRGSHGRAWLCDGNRQQWRRKGHQRNGRGRWSYTRLRRKEEQREREKKGEKRKKKIRKRRWEKDGSKVMRG